MRLHEQPNVVWSFKIIHPRMATVPCSKELRMENDIQNLQVYVRLLVNHSSRGPPLEDLVDRQCQFTQHEFCCKFKTRSRSLLFIWIHTLCYRQILLWNFSKIKFERVELFKFYAPFLSEFKILLNKLNGFISDMIEDFISCEVIFYDFKLYCIPYLRRVVGKYFFKLISCNFISPKANNLLTVDQC